MNRTIDCTSCGRTVGVTLSKSRARDTYVTWRVTRHGVDEPKPSRTPKGTGVGVISSRVCPGSRIQVDLESV